MGCPIFKWYKGDGNRELDFAISSVIEGSLTIMENGHARIVTYELEKRQKFFECAVNNYVKKIFEEEEEEAAQDYGLIILRPGEEKLSESEVVDFISFHRHPTAYTKTPTASRYGISAYNEVFETRAIKERALKKLGESDLTKAQKSRRKVIRESLGVK